MKSKVLLASVALLTACQGHKDKATRTPESVPVRLALPAVHAALNAQAQRLSLSEDTTKYTYLPFHLVIRASNASGFSQSVVVKPDAPEVALELPTGPVKIEALVFGMPMPAGMSKAQMCAREGSGTQTNSQTNSQTTAATSDTTMESMGDSGPPKNYPGGAMVRTFGAPPIGGNNPGSGTGSGSTGTATSGGSQDGDGGMKFLFVSQLVQTIDVQASTDVLPVSLPALKIAKMESLGVRVTDAGKPVANASFKLVDTLSYKPIVDPCDGTTVDIRTDARGRIVDTLPEVGGGVPLFALSLPKGGFAALDVSTSTLLGRFKELKLDTGVVTTLAGTFDFFGVGASLDSVASKGLTYVTTLLEALRRSFGGEGGNSSTADGFWSPGLPLPAPKTFVMQFGETLVVQPYGWLQCGSTASFDPWRSGANIAAEYRWTFKGAAAQSAKTGDNQNMPDSFVVPASAAVGDVVECQSRLVELNAEGAIVGAGSPWSVARVSVNSSTPAQGAGMGGSGQTGIGTGGTDSGNMTWLPDPDNFEVISVGPSGSLGALVRFQFHPSWDPNVDGFAYTLAPQGMNPPACPLTANAQREVDRQTYGLKLSGLTINTNYLLRVCAVGTKQGARLASMGRVVSFQTPPTGSGDASLFDPSIPTPEFFGAQASSYDQISFQFNDVATATGYRVFYANTPNVSLQSQFLDFAPNPSSRWHSGLVDGSEQYYRIAAVVGTSMSLPSEVKRARVTGFRPSPLSLSPEAPASLALRDVDGDMGGSTVVVATKRGVSLRDFDGSWRHFTVSDGLLRNEIFRVRMSSNGFGLRLCAIHDGGGVSYSWDGGSSWFTLSPGGTPDVSNATSCDFQQDALVVGRSSGPLVRKPQFTPAVEMAGSPVANDLAVDHSEIVVAGAAGLFTGDGKGPWQTLDTSAWTRVRASNGGLIVAAGTSGKVGMRKSFDSLFATVPAFLGTEIQGLDIFYSPPSEQTFAVLSNGTVFTFSSNGANPNLISEWSNRGLATANARADGNALVAMGDQFAVASASQALMVGADATWSSLKPSPHATFIQSAFETYFPDPSSPMGYVASGTDTLYPIPNPGQLLPSQVINGGMVHEVLRAGPPPPAPPSPPTSEADTNILVATTEGIYAKQGTDNTWAIVLGGSVTKIDVMPFGNGGPSPLYVAAASSVLKRSFDGLSWGVFNTSNTSCQGTLLNGPFSSMASGNDFTALGRTTGSLALLWKTGPGVNDIACTEFSGTALGISSSSIAELAAVGNAHDGVVVGRTASNKWFMVRKPSNMPIINNGMADGLAGVAGSTLAGVSRFGNDGIALGLNLPSGESRVLTLGTGSSWTETTAHVTLPKLPITKMFPYGNGPLAVSYTNGADGRGGLYVGNLPPNPAFNPSSPPLVQLAFVTSTVYDGNLGGRTGADDKCQVRATDAGIGGGSWKALLSTSSENAVNLISINGQVRLRSGEIVVNNSSQLWGPTSQFAGLFYRDEFGNMVPTNSSIWTGTENTGGLKTSTNCNNWTMNSSFSGTVGNSNSDVLHFNSSTPLCNNFARLICIQQ